ncbi:MAG: 4-alpha-glucanotransferase, partial [Candidatus Omnitrophota bacterium]
MKRGSGILLHVSSLPSRYGIGDLGHEAYKFVDLMAQGKQRLWQMLPVNPTNLACASSPYHSISAFAGNSLFINPDMLIEDGLLEKKDLNGLSKYPAGKVDYGKIVKDKTVWLDAAYENFLKKGENSAYWQFVKENKWWLGDYALFAALKEFFKGKVWCDWPDALQHRNEQELEKARKKLIRRIEKENVIQYIFFKQWYALKKYCFEKGVQIIGDIPIYVQYDSAEVWSNPSVFKLDKDKKPYVVAGVPPDYFSATGQLWGNPLYNWDVLK